MRRSASEIINNLENRVARLENRKASTSRKASSRIARLEKQSYADNDIMDLSKGISKDLSKLVEMRIPRQDVEISLHEFFTDKDEFWEDGFDSEDSVYDLSFDIKEYHPLNIAGTKMVEIKCVVHYGLGDSKRMTFQTIYGRRGITVKDA
jgi:hypothetical protein